MAQGLGDKYYLSNFMIAVEHNACAFRAQTILMYIH
jgi:hypothetical protein